jgi:hypothetical protein
MVLCEVIDSLEIAFEIDYLSCFLLFKNSSRSCLVFECIIILSEFIIFSVKFDSLTLRPQLLENDLQSQTISIKYFFGIGNASLVN